MWSNTHRLILFFLILSLTQGFRMSSIYAEPNSENEADIQTKNDEITVEWRKIPYAKGYIIQIRNDQKQNLIDKKTSTNQLRLKLKPGKYEQRIGVINKFGRLERFSDWYKMKVVLVLPPEISPKESPSLPNKEIVPVLGKNPSLEVKGKNFVPDTKFVLKKGDKEIRPSKIDIQNDGTAKLTFPEGDLPEGEWDLVVENPKKKKKIVPKFAKVYKPVAGPTEQKEKEKEISKSRETVISEEKGLFVGSKEKEPSTENVSLNRDRWSPVWRSSLFPGWGHFYMEKKTKGWIHSGIFTIGFLYFLNSRENLIQSQRAYNNNLNQSLILQAINPGNIGVRAITTGLDEIKFQEFKKASQNYNTSIFILLGYYLLQLYDSYSDSEDWYKNNQSGMFLDGGNRVIGEMDLPQVEAYWKAGLMIPFDF